MDGDKEGKINLPWFRQEESTVSLRIGGQERPQVAENGSVIHHFN